MAGVQLSTVQVDCCVGRTILGDYVIRCSGRCRTQAQRPPCNVGLIAPNLIGIHGNTTSAKRYRATITDVSKETIPI
jgi:hypothetical protein